MNAEIGTRAGRARKVAVAAVVSVTAVLGFTADPALAAYTAHVQNGTLQIVGDGASDKLALEADLSDPTRLLVDVGEDGTTDFAFDGSTFSAINVVAGAGDDEVRADGLFNFFTDKPVTINGGAGNDTLIGSSGADTLSGGDGNDFVDGRQGSDVALLGAGNDTFQWDPGDQSDTVEGQGGTDALDFDGSNAPENIDVSANGPRVRFFRDVANVLMDLNGIETLNVKALGGADTVTVNNLTGTTLKTANVDLGSPFGPGSGDGAADTVIANATSGADNVNVSSSGGGLVVSGLAAKVRVTGAESSLDHVAVNTLDGDDTITSGVGVSGPQSVNIDGGPGTDTTTYSGTSAADAIGIALNGTSVATFTGGPPNSVVNSASVENLVVKGLAGADTIIGQNGIAGLTNLTIDGGPGDDTLTGGDGNDTLIGGDGNDVVDGARGADAALLGAGDDTFVWNPGDQSDTVEGQGGRDTMQFNGSNAPENIDVSANGSRVRLFRDVSGITQDLNGIEAMNIDSLGGTDSITVNDMTGTALKAVALDLGFPPGSGTGDGAPDSVIINGSPGPDHVLVTRSGSQVLTTGLAVHTSITGSEPANDSLHVNTLGGRDTVSVAPDVSTLIAPFVDLGADQ